jgi:hypothetical protein
VQRIVDGIFGEDLHAERVLSLAHGTLGPQYASSLAIHAVGPGLAAARSRLDRRAVKQVDQHLSNRGINLNPMGAPWGNIRMDDRPQAGVKLDWTGRRATATITPCLSRACRRPMAINTAPVEDVEEVRADGPAE